VAVSCLFRHLSRSAFRLEYLARAGYWKRFSSLPELAFFCCRCVVDVVSCRCRRPRRRWLRWSRACARTPWGSSESPCARAAACGRVGAASLLLLLCRSALSLPLSTIFAVGSVRRARLPFRPSVCARCRVSSFPNHLSTLVEDVPQRTFTVPAAVFSLCRPGGGLPLY